MKKRYIKQINDIREWQKKTMEKGHTSKESGVTTGEEQGGNRLSLAM